MKTAASWLAFGLILIVLGLGLMGVYDGKYRTELWYVGAVLFIGGGLSLCRFKKLDK